MATAENKGRIWHLEQQLIEARHRAEAAETARKLAEKQRDEAIRARYTDQAEAALAERQRAIKTEEVQKLTGLLTQTRQQMAELAAGSGNNVAVLAETQLRLSSVSEENTRLHTQAASDHISLIDLADKNRALREEVTGLSGVTAENENLRGQLRFWRNRANLYSSQIGNFLVGHRRVPTMTVVLEVLGGMPVIGPKFKEASHRIHMRQQGGNGKIN